VLEKLTGRAKNYKVTVIEKPGEKIQYPFKLEPGISDQVVTLKILKEEGFGDKFLERAQQTLDQGVM
jgi:DNA mismatch repair ATPase MutS